MAVTSISAASVQYSGNIPNKKDRSQLTFRSFHELKMSGCGFFRVLRTVLLKGQAIARRPNNASALPALDSDRCLEPNV
jgi:hypothetical protein